MVEEPVDVYVDRLPGRVLIVAQGQGAISLPPVGAVELARELLDEALQQPEPVDGD